MVKGILKRYSRATPSRPVLASEGGDHDLHDDESPRRKRVSFDGPEPVKVFEADEWDRSPAAVTLKLTYKDVVELRELNISLVKPSPLAMTRTPSRRPTDRRTAVARLPNDSKPSSFEKTMPFESPSPFSPTTSPAGPQYPTFATQSLGPLLEDAASPPSSPTPVERPVRFVTKAPDAEAPVSASPPGLPALPIRPLLKALGSPVLPPPSPLLLSPPSSRPPSPKPTTTVSPTPLYRHPWARNRATPSPLAEQNTIVLPSFANHTTSIQFDKLTLESDDETEEDHHWKPVGILGLDTEPGRDPEDVDNAAATPVVTRKAGRSLMGWEFKKPNANGKRGFGLVRKA